MIIDLDVDARETLIKVTAIIGITAMELCYMCIFNMDGAIFGLGLAGVCGIAGYQLGKENCKK